MEVPKEDSVSYALRSLLAAKTVIGPFDRVKILFQTSHPDIARHQGRLVGVFHAAHEIYQKGGIYNLYRGHGAMLMRVFPYAAIQYMAFEQYKMFFSNNGVVSGTQRMFAGSLAGATAVFLTYPFDIIRARLAYQVHSHEHFSLLKMIMSMCKERKYFFLAFYQGFGPSLMGLELHDYRHIWLTEGIVPYAGVSFYTFETLKSACVKYFPTAVLQDADGTSKLKSQVKFVCGFIAGAAGQTFAYPFDVIRRRMQLVSVAHHLPRYQHTFIGIKQILQSSGWRGLFVGLSINYLKVAPATGISFVSYEYFKQLLGI